jgi:arylsulfatase A-like enzyme
MNRRRFLKATGNLAAGLGASRVLSSREAQAAPKRRAKPRRPNLLYIMTDQQFAGAMSCTGNKDLRTPAMDSLAKHGVRFDKAYCTQPLCVPSRTVMMTSRMPHETGVVVNRTRRDLTVPMLGKVFAEAGYDTGYTGKWHLTMPQSNRRMHGFETTLCPVGASAKRPKDRNVPPACVEFLKRPRKQPFLLVASFLNPHDICQVARRDPLPNGPISDPPPIEKCPALPANFEIPEHEPDVLRKIQKREPRIYPTVNWGPDQWREYRWAYCRLVEMVDAEIGRLLDTVRELGLEDNTAIVFSSDHGDGTGAHRWNQKQVLYEEPTRVPFIVSYKGVTRPGHVDREHLVSTGLDLMPTLCDYAGIDAPAGIRGMSVRALAEGRSPSSWRDFLVSETTFCGLGEDFGLSGRMLRTNRYKYIVYSKGTPREQLFDMDHDPGETVDLSAIAEHRSLLREHRAQLAAWCKETNDTFSIPGTS